MPERNDHLKRVLGDVEADPFHLAPDSPSRWGWLNEPVSMGWFLGVAAVLALLVLLT
jgi:hypothetical protein